MDHVSSMEERIVADRIRKKLEEVNVAAQKHLEGVQDHVNFTLQKEYFKCAHDCFDRRRTQEGITSCVDNCGVPALSANNVVETEMAKFQPLRLNRSLMVCQDKFEAAKLQKMKTDATNELESCVNRSIDDSIRVLPHLVEQIKSTINMK
ncbi:protein FAM136A [Triticum aestivum]|uniref:protein FAM136A n=1 Tax=Triticum aestivum TaxID=4565 RepID=UPI001D01D36E|nr:protein FAM136A-like [Triticum aestivum]